MNNDDTFKTSYQGKIIMQQNLLQLKLPVFVSIDVGEQCLMSFLMQVV
ncbi:hypothetical protein [Candidatus Parabeggiatoa sp. HSG14]|nr:hypothetical protein [Thiotrichales bacterium HSG14]